MLVYSVRDRHDALGKAADWNSAKIEGTTLEPKTNAHRHECDSRDWRAAIYGTISSMGSSSDYAEGIASLRDR
jgi:hypothetical protein